MLAIRVISVALVTTAMASSAAACGGVDTRACGRLERTLADVRRQAMAQVDDPGRVAQTYASGARSLRAETKRTDGRLRESANRAADALERLGLQVKAMADGTGSTVDPSDLISATNRLKRTCAG